MTIFVGDLDAHVAAIAARGLELDGVRKVLYRAPTATSCLGLVITTAA